MIPCCEAGSAARDRLLMVSGMRRGACRAGLALLGHIDEKFVDVMDVYEPLESGQRDKCFISKGCAAALPALTILTPARQDCWREMSALKAKSLAACCAAAFLNARWSDTHPFTCQVQPSLGPACCRWHAGV